MTLNSIHALGTFSFTVFFLLFIIIISVFILLFFYLNQPVM